MLREQAEFFTPEEIERLLQVAREAFDVCIVDVNAYWDNAATVCSVLQADARVVVTTGDISQFQEDLTKWIGQVGNIFGLEPKSFDLIASLMDKQNHSDHLSIRDIRKETQMYVIGKVHRQSDVVSTLNRGKISELLQSGQPIRNDLHSVTQRFIDKYGLNRRLEGVRVSWFKKLLTGPAAT
jgi:septum formation inhibitor-activating ATPase MinD